MNDEWRMMTMMINENIFVKYKIKWIRYVVFTNRMASGDYEVVELTECFWIIRSEQDILFEVVTEWICEA